MALSCFKTEGNKYEYKCKSQLSRNYGLITAIELERLAFNPIVIEASDRVGGRQNRYY
jgi:hypothetical protein